MNWSIKSSAWSLLISLSGLDHRSIKTSVTIYSSVRLRSQSTSWPNCVRARTRAITNSRSDKRLRYSNASFLIDSTFLKDRTRLSARRTVLLAIWHAAAAAPPPGKIKSLSGGKSALKWSRFFSSRSIKFFSIALWPGIQSSPPSSNRSCWISVRHSRISGDNEFSARITPIALLASSTVP